MAVGRLPPAGRGPSQAFGLAWASLMKFINFFLFLWIKSTEMKVRPYFALQKGQKLLKSP